VKTLARAARKGETRSKAIARLLRERLAAEARRAADAKDLEAISRQAEALNAEVEDVLGYQGGL
jgi:hypothetical protein